jgi:hypothetical protein
MSIAQPSTAVGGGDALKAQFDNHFDSDSTPADGGVWLLSMQCAL